MFVTQTGNVGDGEGNFKWTSPKESRSDSVSRMRSYLAKAYA